MTRASDLADLELAYVPQFGSAKDPVNFLCMVDDLRNAVLPGGGLIVHRAFGVRGHRAVRILAGRGRDAANLDGGDKTRRAGMDSRAQDADPIPCSSVEV